MNNTIWYELKSHTDLNHIQILTDALKVVKIDFKNFNSHIELIQLSIDKFNSEIKWDGMWDLNEAQERVSRNQKLYLFLEENSPIGHVWYIGEFLYNAFVSSKRNKGTSQWFMCKTIEDRFNNGYDTITLYTEDWNIRAIKFWEKLGFSKLNKTDLIDYDRECIPKTQGND
jgi:hypothetical protein